MVLKEILLLSAAIGFLLVWILDISNGTALKGTYGWLMISIGFLFYFQHSKNERLKKANKK